MPDIQRVVTLTSKGNSAGPSFRAQYSNDCITYINTIGTSLINLPGVGSQASITYPDTANCLRLVNQNGSCDNNFVVQIIGTTTTTSTSTTSTTTAPPTTTTTTFSPDPCNCVEVNITSNGGEVATFNCFGQNQNYVYATAGTRYICAAVIGGLLQAEIVSGTGTLSPGGNCKTGPCPPATTTSTSTSTTTLPPTTTTTTTLAACYQGVVVQVTNGDALNWETCYGISDGGAYPVGEHTLPGCIKPLTIVGDGETTFTITSFGTPCTTTTSTSTTTLPTTTSTTTSTTTLAPCYQGVVVQVTNGDALNWLTCAGISDGGAYPVGEHTLPGCIKPETIVGDGETTFTITSFGTPCTTTTSTSTTSTSTTSTTTAPPSCLCFTYTDTLANVPANLNVRYRACSTNTITTTPIDQLEAVDNLDGTYTWYICVLQGSSYATPTCVVSGIEQTCPQAWISGGSCIFNGDCAPTPPTTTTSTTSTSTTTSTTTQGGFDLYTADVFPCNDCGGSTDTIVVAFDAGSSVINNRWYVPQSGPDGNAYRIAGPYGGAGPGLLLTTAFGSFTTCQMACIV
jgi:hypothetical protein